MPWPEVTPVQQRLEFIREYDTGLFTMTVCADDALFMAVTVICRS